VRSGPVWSRFFSSLGTGLPSTTGGGRLSVVGGGRSRMAQWVMISCGSVVVIMVLHCVLDGVKGSEDVSEGRK